MELFFIEVLGRTWVLTKKSLSNFQHVQEEILFVKSRENLQGKGGLSCPLHASREVLSFQRITNGQSAENKSACGVPNPK